MEAEQFGTKLLENNVLDIYNKKAFTLPLCMYSQKIYSIHLYNAKDMIS